MPDGQLIDDWMQVTPAARTNAPPAADDGWIQVAPSPPTRAPAVAAPGSASSADVDDWLPTAGSASAASAPRAEPQWNARHDAIIPSRDEAAPPTPAAPEGNPLSRTGAAASSAAQEAFGDEKVGLSEDSLKRLSWLGPTARTLVDKLSIPPDLVLRSIGAGISGGIGAAGQVLQEAGVSKDTADRLVRDFNMAAQASMGPIPEAAGAAALRRPAAEVDAPLSRRETVADQRGVAPEGQPSVEGPPQPRTEPSAPSALPEIGARIGLRDRDGTVRGAAVDGYHGEGDVVRLRFDNGEVGDFLTSEVQRDRATPPRVEPEPSATRPVAPVDDWITVTPSPAPRGRVRSVQVPASPEGAGRWLARADHLEDAAMGADPRLTDQQRADMIQEATEIRATWGAAQNHRIVEPLSPVEQAATADARERAKLGDLGATVPEGGYPEAAPAAAATADEKATAERARLGALGAAAPEGGYPEGRPGTSPSPEWTQPPAFVRPPAPEPAAGPTRANRGSGPTVARPPDLLEFLARDGGLKDESGDLRAMDAHLWHRGKPFMPRLVRPDGASLNYAREAASEAGYGPFDTPDDLLAAIDENLRGRPVYSERDRAQLDAYQAARADYDGQYRHQVETRADELGISVKGDEPIPDLLARIHEQEAARATPEDVGAAADRIRAEMDNTAQIEDIPWFDTSEVPHEPTVQTRGEPAEARAPASHAEDAGAAGREAAHDTGAHPIPEGRAEAEAARRGPVEEATEQGQQLVIPGAERSARQAAEAREAAGRGRLKATTDQRPADQGLFAAKEPEQGKLGLGADRPEDLIAGRVAIPKEFGKAEDRTADFAHFARETKTGNDPHAVNGAARDYVLMRGRQSGHEYIVAYDAATGRVVEASTSHRPDRSAFSADVTERLEDPAQRIVAHHNHPRGMAVGPSDLGALFHPGLQWVIAHAHDGEMSAARLAPDMRDRLLRRAPATNERWIRQTMRAVDDALRPMMRRAMRDHGLTVRDANLIHSELVNHALHNAGLIDYVGTRRLDAMPAALLDEARQRATDTARSQLQSARLQPKEVSDEVRFHRSAGPVQPEQGVARVLGVAGEDAKPRPADTLGNRERAPDDRAAGARGESREAVAGEPPAVRATIGAAADQAAADLGGRGKGPGEIALQQRDRLPPPTGDTLTKNLNAVEQYAIMPRTLARLDTRSGRYWDAWDRRDRTAQEGLHRGRQMMPTFLGLDAAARRKVYAVEEIDRIKGVMRRDDGRSVVAVNDGDHNALAQAHFTKPGDVARLDTPELRRAYYERRAFFKDVWSRLLGATAKQFGWDGPADPEAIMRAANDAGHPAERRHLQNVAGLIQSMRDQATAGYVPLMRFGDYFISVKPKIEEDSLGGFTRPVRFELVSSQAPYSALFGKIERGQVVPKAARDRLAELQRQFPADEYDIDHGYLSRKPDLLKRLDLPAIEKLFAVMGADVERALGQKVASGIMDADAKSRLKATYGQILDTFRDQMLENLKAGFKREARTVPGYSSDFDRATGAYMHGTAHHIADLVHGDNIRQTYENDIASHPKASVRTYWDKWLQSQEDRGTALEHASARLRQAAFLWQMAMNPSSMALVATHGPLIGVPTLGAGVGMPRAAGAFYKAAAEAMAAIRGDTDRGLYVDASKLGRNPGEKALLRALDSEGRLHAAATEELRGVGQHTSEALEPFRKNWQRATNIAGSAVGVTDQLNRSAMALAAYRSASDPAALRRIAKVYGDNQVFKAMVARDGLTPETVARFMVDEGLFVWGKRNRAPIARGALGTMAFQFHNFVTNALSTQWKFMSRMGPEGKAAGLTLLAGLGVVGGVGALPFSQDIENAYDKAYKAITGRDPQIEAQIRAWLADHGLGKLGAEMVMRGPSRTLLGVDLTSRLGFGDEFSRFTPLEALGAAPGIFVGAMERAWNRYSTGQGALATGAELMPTALKNVVRGTAIYPTRGVVSQRGRVEVPPAKLTASDRVARSLGFESATEARSYEAGDYAYRTQHARDEAQNRAKASIVELEDLLRGARERGDAGAEKSATDRIRAILQNNPDLGITVESVMSRLKAARAPGAAAPNASLRTRAGIAASPFVAP